jgi:putative transposase
VHAKPSRRSNSRPCRVDIEKVTSRICLVQRHSDNLLLVHVVWATAGRAPLLERGADSWLAKLLRRKAYEAGSALLACGNADDHVHARVRYPSTVTVASVVQRLKGASRYAWNLERRSPRLSWQAGSWTASVSPGHLAAAIRYVESQRDHHRESGAAEAWERSLSATPSSAPFEPTPYADIEPPRRPVPSRLDDAKLGADVSPAPRRAFRSRG